MKSFRKIIIFTIIFSFITLIGCTKKTEPPKPQIEGYTVKLPKMGSIVSINYKNNTENIYNIENNKLSYLSKTANLMDLQYHKEKSVYVSIVAIRKGNELPQSVVNITSPDKEIIIKDFYSARDIRLSNNGSRVAFRTFAEDSISSADDVRIYDINGKRYIFDNDVIISGDLYKWMDDNNLLYYGVQKGEQGFGELYKYDFSSNNRTILFNKFKGYCTNFFPISSNEFMAIENNMGQYTLFFYDFSLNKRTDISTNFEKVFSSVYDSSRGNIYFIGKENNEEINSLYSVNLNKKYINRLVYDFPKNVDESSNLILSAEGKIFFVGYNELNSENDVFEYNYFNKSINLISTVGGMYHLFSGVK